MIFELNMGERGGKTTLARTLLAGAAAVGIKALYIVPTQADAREAENIGMPGKCRWLSHFRDHSEGPASMVIFEGCVDHPDFVGALENVKRRAETYPAFQIFILN